MQPRRKRRIILRLHAPENRPVPHLGDDWGLRLVGLVHDSRDFLFIFQKADVTAARHLVIGVPVESHVVSHHLRIIRLADIEPLQKQPRLLVKRVHRLEIRVPVKFLPGGVLDELDAVFYLLRRIILRLLVKITNRHRQLERRHVKPSVLDAISHQGTIARRITMNNTTSDLRVIVLDGQPQFPRRHRADVGRHAVLLGRVKIMQNPVLAHHRTHVNRRDFTGDRRQVRKPVNHVRHHVLVKNDHLLAPLRVAPDIGVAPEEVGNRVRRVRHDEVKLLVRDAKLRPAQALRVAIHEIRHGKEVRHPTVAEKSFQILHV